MTLPEAMEQAPTQQPFRDGSDETTIAETAEPVQHEGLSEQEYTELYSKQFPRIVHLSRRGPVWQEAEDIAQDTFIRAYSSKERFTPGTDFGGWIYYIARSCHMNTVNKARAMPVIVSPYYVDIEELPDTSAYGSGPIAEEQDLVTEELDLSDIVVGRMELSDVVAEIDKLSFRERAVIYGVAFEGQSYAEVARSEGISEDHTRQVMHRARKKLRQRRTLSNSTEA